jgi:hypothetical protein
MVFKMSNTNKNVLNPADTALFGEKRQVAGDCWMEILAPAVSASVRTPKCKHDL